MQSVTQQQVPSKKRSRSEFHIRKGTQAASPSSEKKSMIQPSSCQTTSDSTEDVVILETNPFEFSTVESYPRTSATRAQSRSGTEEVFPNLQRRAKQEVPSEGTCPSENPIRNGAYSESNHDMIQGAAPSSEKKPVVQATSCQTITHSDEDVIILDSNPFVSSTVGSPATSAPRVKSRLNPEEVSANVQLKTQQEVASEKRGKDTQYESYNDVIQPASPSSEKKPVVQVTSCQTASDNLDDVVILDTNPFKSSTVRFDPQNSAPWSQSRSNPEEVFSNLHPGTQQETPYEKRSQTEFQDKKLHPVQKKSQWFRRIHAKLLRKMS
ncbi:uncharacterized protein LOC120709469 [Panicum virgatum]|uniref:Uncharacterized protein n=1 Tax=Panicum virgatum TaxID=38727 RepID=A0A8T0SEK8_PANVG|nr:uncharacterized protein LOC120709469 [Panicum virgatum]XP_039851045.1 uncharacterized protein LOC120709469 [Panicum virgatum]XP_039851046.1 uncharacterized protein LOC120709469 [Panicum virgatum]XP_039851047.1 uncharacterized protein LOC120709469 [Panicum virgatum]XP_039851048.1 uncharacterized protein LOC120709469 [Panicum virgatum]XP_039851049.1 uncharacterized protein LOC120709469 [Panicum virgatum]KAG2597752.1 hypothetical protein PVAP13_5KG222814 [Panicum virgatum]